MKNIDVNNIFKILLTIFLVIMLFNFFVALLPFILIGLLIYMIYRKIKDNKNANKRAVSKEIRKEKTASKKSKIIGEAQVIKEKIVEE